MARLPSVNDLGQRSIPTARRGVNSYSGQAVGQALQQAGQMLTSFGNEQEKKQDRLELARAKSYWLGEQTRTNADFEQDQDYATMQERYGKRLLEAKTNALGMLRDPETRALFETDLQGDFDRGMASIKGVAFKREADAGRAVFRKTTEDNLQSLLQAPDEVTRTSILRTQAELTKAARDRGFMSAEEFQNEGTTFVQNYAVQRAQAEIQSNPAAALQLLKPKAGTVSKTVSEVSQTIAGKYKGVSPTYLVTTAAIETGGSFNPQSFNKNSKAAGMFQIIPSTAKALGVRDPFDPEQAADAAARLAVQNAKVLRGELGRKPTDAELYLAHQQGGEGASALLSQPDENVVDALAKAYGGNKGKARAAVIQNGGETSMSAKEFADLWLNKYSDFEQRYRADQATDVTPPRTDGVQIASLDGGPVSEAAPVQTENTAGALTYFEKTGTWVDYLPYDKRATLINQAETQVRQQQVVNKQLLESRIKDAQSMAMQGFTDPNPPTFDEFEASYDGPEAELRWREFERTQKVAGTIYQAATMTPAQQVQALAAMKPKEGPGFAIEQQNYETLQKAVETANAERKKDPIAFAEKYKIDGGVQPLDMTNPQNLPAQLRQRGDVGTVLNQQYAVPLRVFTEGEAQALASTLNGVKAEDRLGWLNAIQQGLSANPQAYMAALGQLRPGSPVTAYAGTYLGLEGNLVTNSPWFGTPDTVTPQSVASFILQGEDLINPPKDSEGKEQKPALKMPADKDLLDAFNTSWGEAFKGQPQAANDAYQATRSYYAALAAREGVFDGSYDSSRFEKAMTAIMGSGEPVDIGGSKVIAPWGMSEDQFLDGAKVAFDTVVAREGLRSDTWNFNDATFLNTGRPGEYNVMVGSNYMVDKQGNAITIRVTMRDATLDPGLNVPLSVLDQYYGKGKI